jgi:hypothetical protein
MPARRTLPDRPDIDQLKRQAKELLRSHRSGEAECVPRLREHVYTRPSWSGGDVFAAKFSLLDAQLVIAREYGFDNWQGLALQVAQRRGQRTTRAAPGNTPGTSHTTPDMLFLGAVREGALVEAGFGHVVNAAAEQVDARVDAPDFVEVQSVDTHTRRGGQRGEHRSRVVVKLRMATDAVAVHAGSVRIRTSVGVADVPVELTVLPRDARRQRVLVVDSPFDAFSHGGPPGLSAFANVVTAADVDINYAHDLPHALSHYDVVVLSGGPLVSMNPAQVDLVCGLVEAGGRLVVAANSYMLRSVDAANLVLDRHGMHMDNIQPKAAVDASEEDERIALHGVGDINLLKRQDPLTEGIATLVFHRPSPIRVTNPGLAALLAMAPPPFYHGDGFAAVSRGRGEVVALAQSLWAHWAGMHSDNARFLLNLLAVPAPKVEGVLDGTTPRPELITRVAPSVAEDVSEPLSERSLQARIGDGERRSAVDILRELEALREPTRDTTRWADLTYQDEAREQVCGWAYRRTRLIRELYVSHPSEAALVELLPERWALHGRLERRHHGEEELDQGYEEMDAILAADSPPKLAEEARFALVGLLVRYHVGRDGDREKWRRGRNAELRRAMAECLAHHADDRRIPPLLAVQADSHSDDPLEAKSRWEHLASRYPESAHARYAPGKARQADELHQPFELWFEDALSGDGVSISDYRGKPVIVAFWSPSHSNSRVRHRTMRKLLEGYGRDRLACVGICLDNDEHAMRNHCADHGVTWPQWLGGDGRHSPFSLSWGINALPTQFLVDCDGTLYSTTPANHLEWMVPALLGEPLPVW